MSFLYQIIYVFSGFMAFASVLYTDFPAILFLFCLFSVLFLCICCLLQLCSVYLSLVNLCLYVVPFLQLTI
jgi:hypothetical protein